MLEPPTAQPLAMEPSARQLPATQRSVRRPSRLRRALRGIERALALSGLFFLVFHSGFAVSEMKSPSMSPTLKGEGGRPDNDWILYERVSTRFGPPPRFKLIVFVDASGVQVAKRVVGYGGERLRIVDGGLEVDGAPAPLPEGLEEIRYLQAGRLRPREDAAEACMVEPGAVFVLGDNSKDSWDSRFTGGLEERQWKGRVVGVVWPPSRWSWLW